MQNHGELGWDKSAINTENKLQVDHRSRQTEAEVAHRPSILTRASTFPPVPAPILPQSSHTGLPTAAMLPPAEPQGLCTSPLLPSNLAPSVFLLSHLPLFHPLFYSTCHFYSLVTLHYLGVSLPNTCLPHRL